MKQGLNADVFGEVQTKGGTNEGKESERGNEREQDQMMATVS